MALTVISSDGHLKFKINSDFYFNIKQLFDPHRWVDLADACRNNDKATTFWEKEFTTVAICVNTGIVTFQLRKSRDPNQKSSCIAEVIYELNASECEEAFRKAALL
jgi:hypothetical protein